MKQELEKKTFFKGLGVGAAGAGISWICCISPLVLLFSGITTASGALALDLVLYGQYDPAFIMAGVAFIAAAVFYDLRRKNACSLSGVKSQKKMILAMAGSMFVVYLVSFYIIEVLFVKYIFPYAPPPPSAGLWVWDRILYDLLKFFGLLR